MVVHLVSSTSTVSLLKLFYIATNDKVLADAFRSPRCTHQLSQHGSTSGGGASGETKQIGRYTPLMAKVIHRAWERSVALRRVGCSGGHAAAAAPQSSGNYARGLRHDDGSPRMP